MLIFDKFKTREVAEDFTRYVLGAFHATGQVCDSQDESDRIDPFPCVLVPPIALIQRGDTPAEEAWIIRIGKKQFGGHFAGT